MKVVSFYDVSKKTRNLLPRSNLNNFIHEILYETTYKSVLALKAFLISALKIVSELVQF